MVQKLLKLPTPLKTRRQFPIRSRSFRPLSHVTTRKSSTQTTGSDQTGTPTTHEHIPSTVEPKDLPALFQTFAEVFNCTNANTTVSKLSALKLKDVGKRITLHGYLGKRLNIKHDLSFASAYTPFPNYAEVQLVASGEAVKQLKSISLHSPIHVDGILCAKVSKLPKSKGKSSTDEGVPRKGSDSEELPALSGFELFRDTLLKPAQNHADFAEIQIRTITSLNRFPPNINMSKDASFKPDNRHLQLRTDLTLRQALKFRGKYVAALRNQLACHKFQEIETPLLFKSTSEGAREFIVPTRTRSMAYALPQSPQQYKQILMASGISRYFQLVKCFRDEDNRRNRQPEFTQLDLEMAFDSTKELRNILHKILCDALTKACAPSVPPENERFEGNAWKDFTSFQKLTYQDALDKYGSDKPDLRIPGEIIQLGGCDPSLQAKLTSLEDPVIEVIGLPMGSIKQDPGSTRAVIDAFFSNNGFSQSFSSNPHGAPAVFVVDPAKPLQGLSTLGHDGPEVATACFPSKSLNPGDLLILQARPRRFFADCTPLGELRVALQDIGEQHYLLPHRASAGWKFTWIVDRPLFEPEDKDTSNETPSGVKSAHHPFTSPLNSSETLKLSQAVEARKTNPTDPTIYTILGDAYDLVLNGVEVGGGSRRIHDVGVQRYVLEEVLQMPEANIKQFDHLLNALKCGCPPHAGFAFGVDRLMSTLLGMKSMRHVMAFPKNSDGVDPMVRSPARISKEQAKTYGFGSSEGLVGTEHSDHGNNPPISEILERSDPINCDTEKKLEDEADTRNSAVAVPSCLATLASASELAAKKVLASSRASFSLTTQHQLQTSAFQGLDPHPPKAMLRAALLPGRSLISGPINRTGTVQWLPAQVLWSQSTGRRHYADPPKADATTKPSIHDPRPVVLPGSKNGPARPGSVGASTAPIPSSSSSTSPKQIPLVPTSSGPPRSPSTTPIPPATLPTPPAAPTQTRKPRRFRRFLITFMLLSTFGFAGGVYYSLNNDSFHDFFTEYIPFGEEAVLFFEEREFRRRFPAAADRALGPVRDTGKKVTIPSNSGVSWNVQDETKKPEDKDAHLPLTERAQVKVQEVSETLADKGSKVKAAVKSEATKAKEEVKGGVSEASQKASSKIESVKERVAADTQKTAAVVKDTASENPTEGTATTPPKQQGKFDPITRIDPLASKETSDPIIQDLIGVLNNVITVINADSNPSKYASTINSAKSQISSIAKRITDIKGAAESEAKSKIAASHNEFDAAAKELIVRLESELYDQETRWKAEFDAEKTKISSDYQSRLNAELSQAQELAEKKLQNTLLQQANSLKRDFTSHVQKSVETERNSRLGKLTELASSVNDLESLTAAWKSVLDANLRTQHLHVAVEAVRTTLESADRPTPFVRELAALKEIAADDAVVNAAIASINPTAYQKGLLTSAQLIDRFRRVAAEVRKAGLLDEDSGLASHAASVVLSKLMFKKTGTPEGNDVESVLSRTETLLEEGDLDAAAREMNELDGWAKTLSRDWLAEARKVLEVRQALDVIATQARLESLRVD
ncbi:MAG: Formation of crista junctions protein 1 [Vezdaea aestivalis]|nr:MAG: Formation of crista junctions protein 1 [Vezdaea aestivalis]